MVKALDRSCLDALFDAQLRHAPGQLGDNATKEFVLRHVFEIAPELIKEPQDMLRGLLHRHYHSRRIPAILDECLIQVLRQNGLFEDWPLEAIIPDVQAFFEFLQERWPVFLDSIAKLKDDAVHGEAADYGFEFPASMLLPFDHHDVRIYIDNLFLEGLLQPVPHEQSQALAKTWVAYGIKASPRRTVAAAWRGCWIPSQRRSPWRRRIIESGSILPTGGWNSSPWSWRGTLPCQNDTGSTWRH